MNYEVFLLNSIIKTGNVAICLEQNVGTVFGEYKDVWNYIIEFYKEYGECPSKDVIKNNFKNFDFLNTDSPIQFYIDDAKKQGLERSVKTSLHKAVNMLKEGDDPAKVLSSLQADATDLMRDSGRLKDTNIVDWTERAEVLKDRVNDPDSTILGVTSGISVIDNIFGGWQPGDFVVIIGWTGVGKSALTRLFAANAWRAGYRPMIISLEMDRLQEEYRMDTILNQGEVFTNSQLMNGRGIDIGEYEVWAKETFEGKHPIHLITSDGIDVADQNFVEAKIRQYKPDLVILDYHLLFEDSRGGGTETERAKNLSKDFKRMALRNRVPILDVSGVTMKDEHEERPPELHEIAWSKQLSYDSDLVLAIHRERDSEEFQVVSRKVRRSPMFAFYLRWNLNTGKWSEYFDAGDFHG